MLSAPTTSGFFMSRLEGLSAGNRFGRAKSWLDLSTPPGWWTMWKTEGCEGELVRGHLVKVATADLGKGTHTFVYPLVAIYLLATLRGHDASVCRTRS